jgi:hypothetical protein
LTPGTFSAATIAAWRSDFAFPDPVAGEFPLRWKVSGLYLKPIRVQGPIMKPVQIAKFLLREFRGLPLI